MKNQAKKFTYIFISFLIFFIICNLLTWNFYTKDLLSPPKGYSAGALSRLSYYNEVNELKLDIVDLPKKHIEMKNYNGQKIDVLTIGDSFSSDVTGGLNPYYQDYLASNKKLKVLNVVPYKDKGIINTIIIMKNNGFLNKVKPKVIILENVERTVGMILSDDLNFSQTVKIEDFLAYYKNKEHFLPKKNFFDFITDANIRYYLFKFLYQFSEKPFMSLVYIKNTTKPLFSNFQNKILFIDGDILYLANNSPERIHKVNQNLNKLSDFISVTGTKLYFMPAVDKYDLYYNFIKDNNHPKPEFFDIIRKLPRNYYLVDSKSILEKELNNGTKDIFYKDDTHWSHIGRKVIADNIYINN